MNPEATGSTVALATAEMAVVLKRQSRSNSMSKQLVSAAPGAGGIEWADFAKKLFVVEPLAVESMVTKFSKGVEQECIRANVYVVLSKDGSKSEEFEDTLIFPRVLQSQTKRQIGSYVVGRLTQGEAKPGQNPPWELAEATSADLAAAGAFLASRSVKSAAAPEAEEPADDDEDSF